MDRTDENFSPNSQLIEDDGDNIILIGDQAVPHENGSFIMSSNSPASGMPLSGVFDPSTSNVRHKRVIQTRHVMQSIGSKRLNLDDELEGTLHSLHGFSNGSCMYSIISG